MADKDNESRSFRHPISNGPNSRSRDESIGQTGPGLPDDTSQPVDIDPDEEKRISESLLNPKPERAR
jgi:hypothetical protein